jgi:hypothetical protein
VKVHTLSKVEKFHGLALTSTEMVVTNKETTASMHPFGIITAWRGTFTGIKSRIAFGLLAEFVQDYVGRNIHEREDYQDYCTVGLLSRDLQGLDGATTQAARSLLTNPCQR